jgi:endonuclease VIII
VPEGDTVWRTARRLDQALAGGPVVLWDLRFPGVAAADLRGSTTLAVVSRGKHLLQRLDSGHTLHSHLRMDGQWRIEASGTAASWLHRDDLRAAVGTPTWTALGLRLGMLDLLATSDEPRLLGHLGPDLLGPDWDSATAAANLSGSDTTIGAALLDQRNLAGVGTVWAAESLFLQGLHPWAMASGLPAHEIDQLVGRVHRLIEAARDHPTQSSTGIRRPGEEMYVHGRSGRPCRRCGGTVRVAMIGPPTRERTIFYCPGCQRGLGPTDDGRAQRPLGSSGARERPYRRR